MPQKRHGKTSKDKSSNKLPIPKPLTVDSVYATCGVDQFKFDNTKDLQASHDIISQDRAVQAIEIGLGIRKPGYNIYCAGYEGTGKTSVIRTFLEKWSANSSAPNDWVYVYNFDAPETPQAIELTRGDARKLKKRMETLIRDLREDIPAALQSEDYENKINAYLSAANERKAKLFSELEKLAKSMDFNIKSTRLGIETIPIVDGRPVSEKEYSKLDEKQRTTIEAIRNRLEPEVLDFARKVRNIEEESRDFIEAIRGELGEIIIGSSIDPIIEEFQSNTNIVAYLHKVRNHILENLLDFVVEDNDEEQAPPTDDMIDDRDRFRKYSVNVFVDNTHTSGAPVVIESNPTYYNLFGKIEKNVEHGMYLTDFSMIKAGAIQRANGGYLVLNVMDIFRTQSIWDTLKRVLRNRQAFIEDMGEQYSLLPTSGLRPQPIPLDLKVILIGNDDIYHVLFEEDEEFRKIFKIKAEFDFKMERTKRNVTAYASFVATRSAIEALLPFDRSGIAAVVEYGSRLVEDQKLLSTKFGDIKDLTIEADFLARQQGDKVIRRPHVETALDRKYYRLNLVEEQLLDMVRNEDYLLSVDGERVGQVNGLAVYDMGDYSFGKLSRLTCTTSVSQDGIINIERASRMSGKIHDKGMIILSGFLNSLLARRHKLGIAASVCFEQNYSIIDGDSASVAEIVAIVSALGEFPIKQNIAITGSVNQLGDIQPVGGINEKIEGFYKVCKLIGKAKSGYRVVIPIQNVHNLMLHQEVRDAIASGYLEIYPIRHVWEAFHLATGVAFGAQDAHSSTFTPGSALDQIEKKLERIHKAADDRKSGRGQNNQTRQDLSRAAKSRI